MGPKSQILCIGHDPVLNRTRGLLLEPGFEVRLAGNLSDAVKLLSEHRFQVVLLCYSISADDCRALVDFIRHMENRPRILALEYEGPRFRLSAPDEEFRPSGPASLLRKAAAMAGIDLPEPAPRTPGASPLPRGRIQSTE